MYRKKKFDEIQFFIDKSHEIGTRPELFFYKHCLNIFENLFCYLMSKEEQYLDRCNSAVDHFFELGMSNYGDEMKKYITDNT